MVVVLRQVCYIIKSVLENIKFRIIIKLSKFLYS